MELISPHDLKIDGTYYIESFYEGVRTNKYRGIINNLNVCSWDRHNVLEIGNMIEYVNGQETTSTERVSPIFPGNIFYVHVGTNATEPQYWLFYKPVADYLMTTQVLRQRTRLDKVSIWGLYKQHLGKARGEGATSGGITPLTCRRTMQMVNLTGVIQLKYAYLTPEEKKLKSEEWRFRCAKV